MPTPAARALAFRAEAWLRQNLAEPPTIADLCQALGASARTLHEAFREHIGTTPKSYLKTLRLEAGDWLLLACDGLQAHLSTADLQDEMTMLDVPAPMLARALVEKADAAGGSDNCTVIAVACQPASAPQE